MAYLPSNITRLTHSSHTLIYNMQVTQGQFKEDRMHIESCISMGLSSKLMRYATGGGGPIMKVKELFSQLYPI